jgi:hypothetical protein
VETGDIRHGAVALCIIIYLLAHFVGEPQVREPQQVALGGAQQSTPSVSGDLDSAELIVRPGIRDFGFPVRALLECARRNENIKSVQVQKIGQGRFVAHFVGRTGSAMDLYFQVSGETALLVAARGSDGSSSGMWNELLMLVGVFTSACPK